MKSNSEFGASSFNALPGGLRNYDNGTFHIADTNGQWWSSTQLSSTSAYIRNLSYDNPNVGRGNGYKLLGFSVRCVRD